MKSGRLSPGILMLIATVLCGIAAALAIAAAISQPWLGLTLATDTAREAIIISGVANGPTKASGVAAGLRLSSLGPAAAAGPEQTPMGLLPSDLSEDPDGLP